MEEVHNAAEAIDLARDDLSKKLGLLPELIAVLTTEECTWGDTSLGFVDPGESYAQMVVSGYRVVLRAAGGIYEYRFGDGIMKMR